MRVFDPRFFFFFGRGGKGYSFEEIMRIKSISTSLLKKTCCSIAELNSDLRYTKFHNLVLFNHVSLSLSFSFIFFPSPLFFILESSFIDFFSIIDIMKIIDL